MPKGVIRKIVGTGAIGAGVNAAASALGNAIGPSSAVDPGMHYYERMAAMADWHPADVGAAALVGGAVGVGVGMLNRHLEWKKQQAEQHGDKMGRQFS
jgi:hypothetical protein